MVSGALVKIRREVHQDVLVLKDKISEVEVVLLETSEEMGAQLVVEKKKANAEGLRVFDTSRVVLRQEPRALKVKLDF